MYTNKHAFSVKKFPKSPLTEIYDPIKNYLGKAKVDIKVWNETYREITTPQIRLVHSLETYWYGKNDTEG